MTLARHADNGRVVATVGRPWPSAHRAAASSLGVPFTCCSAMPVSVIFCTYDCTFERWRLHLCVGAPLCTYGKVQTIGAGLIGAGTISPSPAKAWGHPGGDTRWSYGHMVDVDHAPWLTCRSLGAERWPWTLNEPHQLPHPLPVGPVSSPPQASRHLPSAIEKPATNNVWDHPSPRTLPSSLAPPLHL